MSYLNFNYTNNYEFYCCINMVGSLNKLKLEQNKKFIMFRNNLTKRKYKFTFIK